MADLTENIRAFFARLVMARANLTDNTLRDAFAAVRREAFLGPPPWYISTPGGGGHLRIPDDNPAFLYQDLLVAIDRDRGINIGEPVLHARCLAALAIRPGEHVLHVGAGIGYYTAILALLSGPTGIVHGREIEADLALRAKRNLADLPWAQVETRSGIGEGLPQVDVIYVNAGLTQPSWTWLDALRTGGRLLFPLQAVGGFGGMLMIERPAYDASWPARFVCRAGFIPCVGPQDLELGRRLTAAFAQGGWERVRAFRTDAPQVGQCWFAGDGWWLATEATEI